MPIPVAVPLFSFTGWKASFEGDLHFYGREGVDFFTRQKTVTQRWRDAEPPAARGRVATAFPTSKDKV